MLYIADSYNNKLRAVDMKTMQVVTLAGQKNKKPAFQDGNPGALNEPAGLCYDGQVLYIADCNNHSIRYWHNDALVTVKIDLDETVELVSTVEAKPTSHDKTTIELDSITMNSNCLELHAHFPKVTHFNKEAPSKWKLVQGNTKEKMGKFVAIDDHSAQTSITVQDNSGTLIFRTTLFYCSELNGMCLIKDCTWSLEYTVSTTSIGKNIVNLIL